MSSPNVFIGDPGDAFQDSDIVTSVRDAKGNDSLEPQKNESLGASPESLLYTYRADVVSVLDGDTLKVSIPLGFGFTIVQKLRLRGLDAPEIESAEGKEAKEFLEEMLNAANSVERGADSKTNVRVLIRTVKSDKYDRYLADVWIDEQYINQALLDEGLAVRVQS